MNNLTALQQAMRIVEQYAPQLFDTYNANGRRFVDEMTKLLEIEREQIENAWHAGVSDSDDTKSYYNARYRATSEKYYNKTYKGGEQ